MADRSDAGSTAQVASLEAENARLREQVARDEGDAATMRGFIATHGCTPSMMYSRAVVAERQLAEAREALGFFASVIMSGEPWTEVCEQRYRAALAPAEKPGSDKPADLPRRPMPSSYTAFDGPSAEPASDGECQS